MSDPFDPKPGPLSFGLRAGRQGGTDRDHPHRTDPEPVISPMSRHAAEWGLASLLCGGIMLMKNASELAVRAAMLASLLCGGIMLTCMPPLIVFDLLFWLH